MIQIALNISVPTTSASAKRNEKPHLSAENFVQNTLKADATIKSAILKLFDANPKIQPSFEAAFFSEMQKAEDMKLAITKENGLHNALVEVIMQNRSQFPSGAFAIKTELPGGGSIETIIPGRERDVPPPSAVTSTTILSNFLSEVSGTRETPVQAVLDAYSSIE